MLFVKYYKNNICFCHHREKLPLGIRLMSTVNNGNFYITKKIQVFGLEKSKKICFCASISSQFVVQFENVRIANDNLAPAFLSIAFVFLINNL